MEEQEVYGVGPCPFREQSKLVYNTGTDSTPKEELLGTPETPVEVPETVASLQCACGKE